MSLAHCNAPLLVQKHDTKDAEHGSDRSLHATRPCCSRLVLTAIGAMASILGGVRLCLTFSATSSASGLCEMDILVVRHAEGHGWKHDEFKKPGLTPHGQQRAESLVHEFAERRIAALYAPDYSKNPHLALHEYETLLPLHHAFPNASFTHNFSVLQQTSYAEYILQQRPHLCGQTAVIAWEHCFIANFLQELGCIGWQQEPCRRCWPKHDFNTVVHLHFANGRLNPDASTFKMNYTRLDDYLIPIGSDQFICHCIPDCLPACGPNSPVAQAVGWSFQLIMSISDPLLLFLGLFLLARARWMSSKAAVVKPKATES